MSWRQSDRPAPAAFKRSSLLLPILGAALMSHWHVQCMNSARSLRNEERRGGGRARHEARRSDVSLIWRTHDQRNIVGLPSYGDESLRVAHSHSPLGVCI